MTDYSDTQICNLAISRLGHKNIISSLESDSGRTADLCRLHYPIARDTLLMAHPWNFAIKRSELSYLSGTTPAFEYDYVYPLPSDCLRIVRTRWESTGWVSMDSVSIEAWGWRPLKYRIEAHPSGNGKALYANDTTCAIEYIARITNTGQFDYTFADLLASRLAAELAMPLTDSPQITKAMWDMFQLKMIDVRTHDAMEGSPRDVVDDDSFARARI